MKKKIILLADHRGFRLKEFLKFKLLDSFLGWEVVDFNPTYNKDDDYPLLVKKAVKKIKQSDRGVFICGSGVGVCIAANRYKKIRAVNGHSVSEVELARKDDDVNVLCLAGNIVSTRKALAMINTLLKVSFKNQERYKRRVKQLKRMG